MPYFEPLIGGCSSRFASPQSAPSAFQPLEIGEYERARALCERLLSRASTLGLYAEKLDPISERHLGNFPQAFTHLALINAVTHVIRTEKRSRAHGFAPATPQA